MTSKNYVSGTMLNSIIGCRYFQCLWKTFNFFQHIELDKLNISIQFSFQCLELTCVYSVAKDLVLI